MASTVARALDPGTVAGALGLAALAGLTLPQQYGLLPPLAAIVAMALLAERHMRRVAAPGTSGIPGSLATQPPGRRVALALTLALPTVVVVTVASRGVSAIVVAYPAAIWGLMLAAFGGLLLTLLPAGAARWMVALGFAAVVPVAAVAGQRWEEAGPQTRGWAHSGALLGIHPFQTTAVIVDGYGPHDIPVNDYVEPDGSRGYGPDELAAALQHSIRAIGRLHYAHGPARARAAYEGVRVIATTTAPQGEERPPSGAPSDPSADAASDRLVPRLLFFSGTTGQRSRIEFVCPGQREDPRGVLPDPVTNPMCPSKYITEASAGLQLTGRWAGYTEGRGQERLGLARMWLGGTRTDDVRGGQLIEREIRWGAWLLLAGLAAVAIPRRARGTAQTGLAAIAGGVAILALVAGVWAVLTATPTPALAWIEVRSLGGAWDITAWTPALAIGAIAVVTQGPQAGGRGAAHSIRLGAVPLALGVLASAGALGAVAWLKPDLDTAGDALAFERFIAGAADALWAQGFGLDDTTIQAMEAAVAAVLAVLLTGAALALLTAWGTATDPPPGAPGHRWVRAGAVLGVAAVAALVIVSRKTAGGAALLPAAMAILLVHGSCLGLAATGGALRSPGNARVTPGAALVHVGLVALGGWVVVASTRPLPSHVFVAACTGLGLAACLGALVFLTRRPGSGPPEGPADGA